MKYNEPGASMHGYAIVVDLLSNDTEEEIQDTIFRALEEIHSIVVLSVYSDDGGEEE